MPVEDNAEYVVEDEHFASSEFERALTKAFNRALTTGHDAYIDLLIYDQETAERMGYGDIWRADPEHSVTERVVISAQSLGRVS